MELINIIGINFAIALILVIGAIIGFKDGFKKSVVKLSALVVTATGLFFLAPFVSNLLLKITFISGFIGTELVLAFTLLVFTILTILVAVIEFSVINKVYKKAIVKKLFEEEQKSKRIKRVSNAKVIKSKRELAIESRERSRRLFKSRPKQRLESKFFGLVFGLVVAALFSIIVYLPVREINKVQPIVGFEKNIIEIVENGTIDKVIEIVR